MKRTKEYMLRENRQGKNPSDALNILWEEGFFKSSKNLAAVIEHLGSRNNNFSSPEISKALSRASFLRKSGRRGSFQYAQKLDAAQNPLTNPVVGFHAIHKDIIDKCTLLYESGAYAEAVEKSFKIVRDRLRKLTGHETGSEAFGKGKLHIKGASAVNVDNDFNQASKFLMMAIDMFRNEKSHTSDAKIDDPVRAYQYLILSSLALSLLDNSEVLP